MEYTCPRCGYKTISDKRISNHFERINPCKITNENLTYEQCKKKVFSKTELAPEIKKDTSIPIKKRKKPIEPEIKQMDEEDLVDKIRNLLIFSKPRPVNVDEITDKVETLKIEEIVPENCIKCGKIKFTNYFFYSFDLTRCRTCWNKEHQTHPEECVYDTLNRYKTFIVNGVNIFYTQHDHAIRYNDWFKIKRAKIDV